MLLYVDHWKKIRLLANVNEPPRDVTSMSSALFFYNWIELFHILCLLTAAITDVHCRTNGDYRNFIIRCQCHEIIHIRSVFVGFSRQPCPSMMTFCIRDVTNQTSVMNCTRNTACAIPESILRYKTDDEQCSKPKKGSSISITYDCITSGKKKHRSMDFTSESLSILHDICCCTLIVW